MSEDNPPKKVMSDEALQKLALRQKALQVRRQQKIDKLKAETKQLETNAVHLLPRRVTRATLSRTSSPRDPPPEDPHPPPKRKAPPKADPVVVVEQSSDDEDEFSAPPGVIFVKRRRSKKEPSPPPPSREEQELDYAYRMMVSGQFRR